MKKSLLICAVFLLVAGLTGATAINGQKVETVDGVKVVHNPAAGKWSKSPQVSLQAVQTIGNVDSDDENIAFHMPSDLAVDADGRIYILDTGNHRIQVFDKNGKYLKTVGRQGQGPGEFFMPGSLELDGQGHLIIGESSAARIQSIGLDGKLGKTIKMTDGMVGKLLLLRSGQIVMAGAGGGLGMIRISSSGTEDTKPAALFKVLDADGKIAREFGRGSEFGDFMVTRMANEMYGAVGPLDDLYAVFPYQNRIERYSSDGRLLWRADRDLSYSMEIKGKGDIKSEGGSENRSVTIKMPDLTRCATGTAVDGKGRLWVVTLNRQLRKEEIVQVSMMMTNNNGVTSGKETAKGDVELRSTDAYKLEVFDADGALLGSVPVKTFVDGIFIKGDRLFLLDKLRGVQIHEFKIIG
jgi:sugar lactone lactonase YvrE